MASETFTVTLSQELATAVRSRIASGEFANESEVITAALFALDDEPLLDGEDLERWLREEAVPVAERMAANPSEGVTPDEVMRRVDERLSQRELRTDAA